jgi:hypothetical protein
MRGIALLFRESGKSCISQHGGIIPSWKLSNQPPGGTDIRKAAEALKLYFLIH